MDGWWNGGDKALLLIINKLNGWMRRLLCSSCCEYGGENWKGCFWNKSFPAYSESEGGMNWMVEHCWNWPAPDRG